MSGVYDDIESMVQKYVLGQLSENEKEDFEAYFLDKPDIVEKISMAQNMHIALSEYSQSPKGHRDRVAQPASGIYEKRPSNKPLFVSGLVGILTGMALVSSPMLLTSRSDTQLSNQEILAFSTAALRSADNSSVSINTNNIESENAIFLFRLEQLRHSGYRVLVKEPATKKLLWQSEVLKAEGFSALRDQIVLLPLRFESKTLEVEVVGLSDDGEQVPLRFCHYSEACN